MGRFDGHDPAAGHDSAGTPWAGRRLEGTGFDRDTGEADPQLLAAVDAAAADGPAAETAMMQLLLRARLLVPVVAVPGEVDDSSGLPVDVSSDMAVVTLVAPDGQRALPAFTSLAALQAWDPSARPVPVGAQRAAEAAVQEGCQVLVLDLPGQQREAGERAAYALRPSMLWALAMGREWQPAHQDPHVARAVAAALAPEPDVTGHHLGGGPQGALRIVLELRPGLDAAGVQDLVRRVGERVATDGETRARIDALAFALRSDAGPA